MTTKNEVKKLLNVLIIYAMFTGGLWMMGLTLITIGFARGNEYGSIAFGCIIIGFGILSFVKIFYPRYNKFKETILIK